MRSLSNLFRSGFDNIKQVSSEPFVLDVKNRLPEQKIVRPVEEREEEVLPANEEVLGDAMDKAKSILEDSRAQAADILERAKADAEKIREDAHNEGYDKGLEEGNMEAMKRADKYLERIEEEKAAFMQNYDKEAEEKIAAAETTMVDMLCKLVEKMTGMLVDEYKPVMFHMINQALAEQDTGRSFIIRVAEETYPYIKDNYDRLVGATNPSITLEVYGDAKLDKRQCMIETEGGIVDLSMDVQIQNLIKALRLLSET